MKSDMGLFKLEIVKCCVTHKDARFIHRKACFFYRVSLPPLSIFFCNPLRIIKCSQEDFFKLHVCLTVFFFWKTTFKKCFQGYKICYWQFASPTNRRIRIFKTILKLDMGAKKDTIISSGKPKSCRQKLINMLRKELQIHLLLSKQWIPSNMNFLTICVYFAHLHGKYIKSRFLSSNLILAPIITSCARQEAGEEPV